MNNLEVYLGQTLSISGIMTGSMNSINGEETAYLLPNTAAFTDDQRERTKGIFINQESILGAIVRTRYGGTRNYADEVQISGHLEPSWLSPFSVLLSRVTNIIVRKNLRNFEYFTLPR